MNKILPQISEIINTFLQKTFNSLAKGTGAWEHDIKVTLDDFINDVITTQLQALDDAFFHSDLRKKSYLSKDCPQRTITTTLGTLIFKRRRYIRRDGKGWYYHIDSLLNIDKYERISKDVKVELLRLISEDGLSYQKAADRYALSKTVVYYLLESLELLDTQLSLDEVIECDYLHVIADEDHISCQEHREGTRCKESPKSNSYIVKHVTIFTDVQKVSKHRNALVDRITLTPFFSESSANFYERVNHFIYENYNVKHEIYSYGDGANWIKALASEINAKFILDKFHMQQALVRIGGGKKNKELLPKLQNLLSQNKKKEFFALLDEVFDDKEISDFKQKQINYIKNQWNNYQRNFKLPNTAGCAAEGINSHYFSSRLSSRPRGFALKTVHNLAFLLTKSCSQHNLISSIKELLPTRESSNTIKVNENKYYKPVSFPILQFGQTSGLYKRLQSINQLKSL